MSEIRTSTYVTIHGLPLTIELNYPFHHSVSGADFEVLHGQMLMADDSGMKVEVSVHVSQVVREHLPSLDASDTEAVVVNALRKEVDRKQLEFLKSGKRQPIPLSTRFMNFRTKQWQFSTSPDEEIATMLRNRVYWAGHKLGAGRVRIVEPTEAIYTGATLEKLAEIARGLAAQGFITLDGEHASATEKLIAMGAEIEQHKEAAFLELQQKHAYEHAVKK